MKAQLTLAPLFALALVPCGLLSGCFLVPDGATPEVGLEAGIADKYVRRGMPQNRNWVAQGAVDVALPSAIAEEDAIRIGAWANMDLKDNTGSAWFPNGHDGRFSQIDFAGSYTHVMGSFDLTAGIENYNVPFGPDFPFGVRSSTNEAFLHIGTEVLEIRPELQLRWDFDQAEGFYGRFGLIEDFELTEELQLSLQGFIGYTSENMALWQYGFAEQGFSDLEGSAILAYALDDHTTIAGHLDVSTMVDSDLRDWFDLIGIPETNLWSGVFVRWVY